MSGCAELTSTGNIDQGHIVYYRARKSDCSGCALKSKCTTAVVRKITRDLNEDVRDRVRALANTEAFQQSRRERWMLFSACERAIEAYPLDARTARELGKFACSANG